MSNKTQEIITKLQEGIEGLFEGDRYKEYLRFLSRFHNYSAGNCLLILMQCPTASLVASYTEWKRMGRQVNKGETGLKILAPHTYKEEDEEGEEHVYTGFHSASVFDVSQTHHPDGKALPDIVRVLDGSVCDYRNLLDVLMKVAPVPVGFEAIDSGANGYYSHVEQRIAIKQDMSEAQTIKTLLHETAHAMLHGKGCEEEKADRRTREVQAESIAYVVSNYLGLDTSEYSFGYIAGWSDNRKLPELRTSLEIIRKTSDIMINNIDNMIHEKDNAVA